MLEIYADGTVDFSLYSLERMSNGGSWGSTTNLTALGTVTNDFVYIYSDSSSPEVFSTEYPSATIAIENSVVNVNGDDGLRIILDSDSSIIDQYGADATDGTGEVWEYADGFAKRIDGTGPDGGFAVANWTFSNGALNNGGTCQGGSTFESMMGGIGTYSTTPSTDPTLYLVDGPANGSTIEVGPEDLAGDLEFGTTNFVVDTPSAGDGYIKWSIINVTDGGTIHASGDIFDTSQIYPFAALEPFKTYTLNAELVDNSGASLSSPVVYTITANTLGYNSVSDLSGVRAGTEGLYYEVTGEVIISYIVTENSRNQKYIQDTSGGILIDDNNGVISTSFNIGDGLTGLKGQLSSFSGVLQLVPTVNVASASSTGVTIAPEEVTAADLFNNGENYESELIKVSNVTFTPPGGTFSDNTSYDIVDGTTTTTCRVSFGDEDLIGTSIPNGSVAITGLGGDFNGTYQILPRYLSDIEATLSSESFNLNSFKVFPNPTSLGYVTISSKNSANMSVAVFDILGKQVINETLSNNTLNVSNLKSGVYIIKVSQDEASVTKKLVIQ